MKIPGLVIPPVYKADGRYRKYCNYLNEIVQSTAQRNGKHDYKSGKDIYVYKDKYVKFTYIESGYSDEYLIEINRRAWDDLPSNVNHFLINEGGSWNYVYGCNDDGDPRLKFHIPGDWLDIVEEYE